MGGDHAGPNIGQKRSVQLHSYEASQKTSKVTTPLTGFDQASRAANNRSNNDRRGKNSSSKVFVAKGAAGVSSMDDKLVDGEDAFQELVRASRALLNSIDPDCEPDQQPVRRKYYYISMLRKVHTYKAFESFGELALIQNKRRAAKLEVNGSGDAYFAILSKKDYRQAQYKAQNEILQGKIAFLRKFVIFQNLSDHALSGLTYQMKEIVCQRGQEIYREDVDVANKIFLVKKGEFKSLKKIPNKDASTEESLMDIGKFVKNEQKYEDPADTEFNAGLHVRKFK